MRKTPDLALVLLLLGVMLLGLGKTLLLPKDTNYYENRTANQPPRFTVSSWLAGDYQDGLEAALSDQVPLAQRLELGYHQTTNVFLQSVLEKLIDRYPDRYFSYHGMMLFGGDTIVYPTVYLDERQEALDRKLENLNAVIAAHPELTFYVYYIEKDTDINFESGYLCGLSDYVLDGLKLPEAQKGRFTVHSFEEFRSWFYRTDHHWNWEGSRRGYLQIMDMLGKPALTPAGPEFIAGGMCGSKARVSGGEAIFTEDFYAYRWPFPEMEITVNGQHVNDFGMQDETFGPDAYGTVGYSGFYGGDDGEIHFHVNNPGAGSLLILGESFDNAVLKLIASGFEDTWSVDLRNYEHDTGKVFSFSDYVAEHGIDRVLLIGNIDYFVMDEFRLEDAP